MRKTPVSLVLYLHLAKIKADILTQPIMCIFTCFWWDDGTLRAAPIIYSRHTEHICLSALQAWEEATSVSWRAGRKETSRSLQGRNIGCSSSRWSPGRLKRVRGTFHNTLDVDRNTRSWKRNYVGTILRSRHQVLYLLCKYCSTGLQTNLPEWTISCTLLNPSHVLLMALTVTVYCWPHCKLVIVQLESSVMQRSTVPAPSTAVTL